MDRETAKQIYDQGFEIVYMALKKIVIYSGEKKSK